MEISQTSVSEDRIAALEKRVRDMDALVRGLVDELLDLKSVAMILSRQAGKPDGPEFPREPVAGPSEAPSGTATPDGTVVVRQKGAGQPDVPAALAEPAMVRIMQADGTMKLEPRYGDKRTR
jgi:hypothetical protein